MGEVAMYAAVSVDGFIADEDDQPGPLFEWLTSDDVPLDDSGVLKVTQASCDHTRPDWDSIGATVVGRHVFDLTDGWDVLTAERRRAHGRGHAPTDARGLGSRGAVPLRRRGRGVERRQCSRRSKAAATWR
jgi:hypothetical protein